MGSAADLVVPSRGSSHTGLIWSSLPPRSSRLHSMAGEDALHQLLDGGHEAVGVERVVAESVHIVAGEHQLILQGRATAVRDLLEGLLDAERARVGGLAGRVVAVIPPVAELAVAEAAHAVGL